MNPLASGKQQDDDYPSIVSYAQSHHGIIEHLHALSDLPALLEPAKQARKIAADSLAFFDQVIAEHHALEERELFPAVLEGAASGEETVRVLTLVARLTAEHRLVEADWRLLKSDLERVSIGHDADLDIVALGHLVTDYWAHAAFEEEVFLPLAQTILGRSANLKSQLGMSIHARPVSAGKGI